MIRIHRDWTRTVFLRGDDEDYTMTTRARLLERIRVTLAGRAAEETVLGNATTYSVRDLKVGHRGVESMVSGLDRVFVGSAAGMTSGILVFRY